MDEHDGFSHKKNLKINQQKEEGEKTKSSSARKHRMFLPVTCCSLDFPGVI